MIENARYWLFSTRVYEAAGGLRDLKKISDNVQELMDNYDTETVPYELYEIIDTKTWTIIFMLDTPEQNWVPVNITIKIFHKE